jgi:hypothetical protein
MKRVALLVALALIALSTIAFGQMIQKGDFAADINSEGWTLGGGNGVRTHIIFVTFEKPFEAVPQVLVSLTGTDASVGKDGTVRVSLKTEKVSREGFVIKVQTWADSRVGAVYGSWIAFTTK